MADTTEQARDYMAKAQAIIEAVGGPPLATLASLLAERDALAAKLAQARWAVEVFVRAVDSGVEVPRALIEQARALAQEPAPAATEERNTGHGHVYPRPDGVKARCGGPGICKECSRDLARKTATPPASAPAEPVAQEPEVIAYLYHDAQTAEDAHPWLHSTMLVLAADRRPRLRNETPLVTQAASAAAIAAARREERERCRKVAHQAIEDADDGEAPAYRHAQEVVSEALRSLGDE